MKEKTAINAPLWPMIRFAGLLQNKSLDMFTAFCTPVVNHSTKPTIYSYNRLSRPKKRPLI